MSDFWHDEYVKKAKSDNVITQSGRGNKFHEKDIEKLAEQIDHFFELDHSHTLLDLGSANGLFAKVFSSRCQRTIAVDPVWALLRRAQNYVNRNSVNYVAATGTDLPLVSHNFDKILVHNVLQLVSEQERDRLFEECYRVAKSSAQLFFGAILDDRKEERLNHQYLATVDNATHLKEDEKEAIHNRIKNVNWHRYEDICDWWYEKGAEVKRQSLPQTDPNFEERYHLLVAVNSSKKK